MFCYVGYGGNGAVVILSMGLLQRLLWMSLKASKGLPQGMDSFINLSTYRTILRSSNRLSSVVIIANPLYSMGEALSSSGRLPPDEKKVYPAFRSEGNGFKSRACNNGFFQTQNIWAWIYYVKRVPHSKEIGMLERKIWRTLVEGAINNLNAILQVFFYYAFWFVFENPLYAVDVP